jgi:hypothetical protein
MVLLTRVLVTLVVSFILLSGVSSAATIDLMTVDESTGLPNGQGTANGALFMQASLVIGDARFHNNQTGSVLKIQNRISESGYNTGAKTPPLNASKTRDILVSELAARLVDENWYYEFIVKINETGATGKTLSVNVIELYTSATAGQTTLVPSELGTLRWSLDGDVDNRINLDYGLSGPNVLDMIYYVPMETFLGSLASDHLYMYYEMGEDINDPTAYDSQNGPEEMALFTTAYYGEWVDGALVAVEGQGAIGGTPGEIPVPEPATLSLLVFGGVACLLRRRK